MEISDLPEFIVVIAFAPGGGQTRYRFIVDPNGNNIILAWKGAYIPPPSSGMNPYDSLGKMNEMMGPIQSWLDNGGEKLISATGVTKDGCEPTPMVIKTSIALDNLRGATEPNVFIHWQPDERALMAPSDRRIRVK